MHIPRAGAAIATAALGGAALLSTASTASAATPETGGASPCQITAALSGIAGKTVVAGGAPISGGFAFTNVSGKTLSQFAEIMAAGAVNGNGPSKALKIQAKHNGQWLTMPYLSGNLIPIHVASPGDNSLKPGNVDTAPLEISAPKDAPTGTYLITVSSGGSNVGPAATAHTATGVPTQFSGCEGGVSVAMASFKVVAAAPAGTPSAKPTANATASPTSSAAAPVASPSGPALAETGGGSGTGPLIGSAAALVAAGAGAVALMRRRRTAQHN
ncbi:LAETG motif-containing sortase-dependent surface protein [Streptacidiphilus sp. EB129]|uniref:LAETG motif-containing sortase-dependent surface protein n=1 Tax=Streptacidiphilus sp. EB129 TaxID=3156262 RepID=UPI00351819F0